MIMSIYTDKAFNKMATLRDKNIKLGLEGTFCNNQGDIMTNL